MTLKLSHKQMKSHDQNMVDEDKNSKFWHFSIFAILSLFLLYVYRCTKQIQREVIVFTRYPIAGKAKTRLVPSLGSQGAANLQVHMVSASKS